MHTPLDALRAFRMRAADGRPCDVRPPASVLFVLCSEHAAGTAFAAAIEPALALQNLGGFVPGVAGDQATLAYALTVARVRHVVVTGHAGCHAEPPTALDQTGERFADTRFPSDKLRSQAAVLLQADRIRAQARSLDANVTIHALWFDDDEGDVYAYRPDERRFGLLSDLDVQRLLDEIEALPA